VPHRLQLERHTLDHAFEVVHLVVVAGAGAAPQRRVLALQLSVVGQPPVGRAELLPQLLTRWGRAAATTSSEYCASCARSSGWPRNCLVTMNPPPPPNHHLTNIEASRRR